MLNQMLSIFFGNRTDHTTNSGLQVQQSKKRSISDLGRNDRVTRKRGRPPLKFSNCLNLKSRSKFPTNSKSEEISNDSDYTDCENDVSPSSSEWKRTNSNNSNKKNSSNQYSKRDRRAKLERNQETRDRAKTKNIQNSNRSYSNPSYETNNSTTAAPYMSSAQMRRSRRSKTIDTNKELIILMPDEDPHTNSQLDIRTEVEWEEFCVAMNEEHLYSDNEEDIGHGGSLSSIACSNDRLWNVSMNRSQSPIVGNVAISKGGSEYCVSNEATTTPFEVCIPAVRAAESYKIISLLERPLIRQKDTHQSKKKKTSVNTIIKPEKILEEQSLDRQANGYDCYYLNKYDSIRSNEQDSFVNPTPVPRSSSVYIDYDADSEDEEFVHNLNTNFMNTKSKSTKSKAPLLTNAPVFKVRCFEILICRLERHLELARHFHSKQDRSNSNTILCQFKDSLEESMKSIDFSRNFLKRVFLQQNQTKNSAVGKLNVYKPIREMLLLQPVTTMLSHGLSSAANSNTNLALLPNTNVMKAAPPLIGRPPKNRNTQVLQSTIINHTNDIDHNSISKEKKNNSNSIVNIAEYLTKDSIMELVQFSFVMSSLQNIFKTFFIKYQEYSNEVYTQMPNSNIDKKNKKIDSSLIDNHIKFSDQQELIILNKVYSYWVDKRSKCSTSLIRGYHSYMMDLWCRADDVALPEAFDYNKESIKKVHTQLTTIRRSLDRARLITDRVRRREKLKRDLIRNSSDQLDVVIKHVVEKQQQDNSNKLINTTSSTTNKEDVSTLSFLRSRNITVCENSTSQKLTPKQNLKSQTKNIQVNNHSDITNNGKLNKSLDNVLFSISAEDCSSECSNIDKSSKKTITVNALNKHNKSSKKLSPSLELSDDESSYDSLSSYESSSEEEISNNIINKNRNSTNECKKRSTISLNNLQNNSIQSKTKYFEKEKLIDNNRTLSSVDSKKQNINVNSVQQVGISPVISIGSNSTARSTRSHCSTKNNNTQTLISPLVATSQQQQQQQHYQVPVFSLDSNNALGISSILNNKNNTHLNDNRVTCNNSNVRGSRSRLSKIPDCSLRNLPSTTAYKQQQQHFNNSNNSIVTTNSTSSRRISNK